MTKSFIIYFLAFQIFLFVLILFLLEFCAFFVQVYFEISFVGRFLKLLNLIFFSNYFGFEYIGFPQRLKKNHYIGWFFEPNQYVVSYSWLIVGVRSLCLEDIVFEWTMFINVATFDMIFKFYKQLFRVTYPDSIIDDAGIVDNKILDLFLM